MGSLQEETTILSIPNGDLDSLHPEDAKYSKQWKEKTVNVEHIFH